MATNIYASDMLCITSYLLPLEATILTDCTKCQSVSLGNIVNCKQLFIFNEMRAAFQSSLHDMAGLEISNMHSRNEP